MNDDDRIDIEEHLKLIDENNHKTINNLNKHIYKNDYFNQTLNRLKSTIDVDRKTISEHFNTIRKHNDEILNQVNHLDILLELKILSDNLEHIQNNIVSAKINVMTSNILTNKEINDFKIDFYELQYMQLGVAKYKEDKIIFVIKFPKDTSTVKRSLITPIPDTNFTQLNFKPQEVIHYNGEVYEYKQNPNIKETKKSNLCIYKNNCKKIREYKKEIIEIEPGLILLKNSNGSIVTSNCDERNLSVSKNYLFTFHDCKINIDNETFVNSDKTYKDHFIIPSKKQMEFDAIEPTLDEIVLSEIENVKEIEELKYHKKYSNKSILTIFIIITVLLLLFTMVTGYMEKIQRKLKEKIQENFITRGEGVTSEAAPTSPKININWQK